MFYFILDCSGFDYFLTRTSHNFLVTASRSLSVKSFWPPFLKANRKYEALLYGTKLCDPSEINLTKVMLRKLCYKDHNYNDHRIHSYNEITSIMSKLLLNFWIQRAPYYTYFHMVVTDVIYFLSPRVCYSFFDCILNVELSPETLSH